eukprot:1158059-Pelagomonas_calceolata.AAC.3
MEAHRSKHVPSHACLPPLQVSHDVINRSAAAWRGAMLAGQHEPPSPRQRKKSGGSMVAFNRRIYFFHNCADSSAVC